MRILFLIYHGFSEHSGISKKIHYQVKGLLENGHDVRLCYYDFSKNGHRCRYVDDVLLKDYGKGVLAAIRHSIDYNCILNYCLKEKIEFVYARSFMNASPWLAKLFMRLQTIGIHSVTEIPTYPYDSEFNSHMWKQPLRFIIDKRFREKLYQYMDAVVTFSDAREIFGQRTINISNGVDLDSIPLQHSIQSSFPQQFHLIGVAEVHFWHGFDRLISGLGEYYKNGGKCKVFFHIVGGVWQGDMYGERGFQNLIERYGLNNHVIFHGQLFGKALDEVFNLCQFAIGSLGRHRCGITDIKTLKNREYATRGIPFIFSEHDSDFDNQHYVLKAPADESPINIQQILDFIDQFKMKPEDIRKTVEHLTWKVQMQKVLDSLF